MPAATVWDNINTQQRLQVRWLSGTLLCACQVNVSTRIRDLQSLVSYHAGRPAEIAATDNSLGPFDSDKFVLHILTPGEPERTVFIVAVERQMRSQTAQRRQYLSDLIFRVDAADFRRANDLGT